MDGVPEVGFVPRGPLTAAIKAEIEHQVGLLVPPGRDAATLVLVDPTRAGGASAIVATKIGEDWTLAADASVTWGGDLSGRVLLTGSWNW